MNDRVYEAMKEIWEWKRQDEEATRGMGSAEVIDFYRREAEDTERRLGLHLKAQNASDAARARVRD